LQIAQSIQWLSYAIRKHDRNLDVAIEERFEIEEKRESEVRNELVD
jgi:hypothetical protein